MGKTTDAFKREIGKNAGKAVSTWIFGDAHATPYRRIDAAREKRAEAQITIANAKADEVYEKNRRLHKDQMFLLDEAVLKNIDTVANIRVPDNKEELIALLSELSTHVVANRWHSDNDDESKIRNKFCDALFSKYSFCVQRLQILDNAEPQLFYFESVLRKAKKDRFWKCYGNRFILIPIGFIGFFGILPLILIAIAEDFIFELLAGLAILLLVSFIIWLSCFIVRTIKQQKLKKLRLSKQVRQEKQQNVKETAPLQQTPVTAAYTPQQHTDIVSTNDAVTSVINLNENNRIENQLITIWGRYLNKVDREIIGRRPIFAAEGERDSILFVGVNPSFIPEDDNVLPKSKNGIALLYRSQYQLPEAPIYFSKLEQFAARAGHPYTHINLLYARENNRDKLLNLNGDFIREQLELTYDTILRINPFAIVFFSEYAYKLIFGRDRWVDPNSENMEHYVLRGTSIPVFFSEDIMEMTPAQCTSLIRNIKQLNQ